MSFRASFCDPFQPDIIEMGDIHQNEIISTFEKIPWSEILQQMLIRRREEIYYSPSLEIENKDNQNGLAISAVGDSDNFEYYIFYKRPKLVKSLFGSGKIKDDYLTDLTGQTTQDVLDCLNALIENNLEFLEEKIK